MCACGARKERTMKTKQVVIVPYSAAWPDAFEKLKDTLLAVLEGCSVTIEHVGSTSVPGLAAKPILDVDVVMAAGTLFSAVREKLEQAGYRHEGDLGITGREAFRYDSKPGLMAHHLYVCAEDSRELRRHIAFRNHLRISPEDRERYGQVKTEAAALHPRDMDGYMQEKASCIMEIYTRLGLE
jgi:GrpB-like predicted nucleotidyltransferase (UPF0157 family)